MFAWQRTFGPSSSCQEPLPSCVHFPDGAYHDRQDMVKINTHAPPSPTAPSPGTEPGPAESAASAIASAQVTLRAPGAKASPGETSAAAEPVVSGASHVSKSLNLSVPSTCAFVALCKLWLHGHSSVQRRSRRWHGRGAIELVCPCPIIMEQACRCSVDLDAC